MTDQVLPLDERVGQVKRAAIDAWMHDQGWRLYGDHYEYIAGTSSSTVSRPGPDGEGGGEWSVNGFGPDEVSPDGFQEPFASIRQTIDALVAPWRTLPEPDDIAPLVEECRQVTRALSGAATAAGGQVTGAGELGVRIRLIEQNLSSMAGTLIASYKSRFLGQLGAVVGGFHAISVVRGTDLAAQQSLWNGARQHLDDVLDMAQVALANIATRGDVKWRDVLTVVGWAAKGAGFFATGGMSTAFEVTGLAITVLSATTSSDTTPEPPGTPHSYDAALDALRTQLDLLASRIRAEEQLIEDNLRDNLAIIERDRTSFDLSQPPIYSLEDTVILEYALVEEIYGTYMPEISTELDSIAGDIVRTVTRQVLTRNPSIGIGPNGTSAAFWALNQLMFNLVKDLAWEVQKGADNLRLAVAAMEQLDADLAERLRRIAERIDEGSPYAPRL